ncbi:MAG: AraC family transcriptional regulator [Anaerolineae bacterium]|nr:AraC family transcriptional regulator [Anaerolineae bacterium]
MLDMHEQDAIAGQPQVKFLVHHPCPPLSQVVDSCWYYESALPLHAKEYHLPSGAMQLLISLHEDHIRVYDKHHHHEYERLRPLALCGMYTEPCVIDTFAQTAMMGVCFKPDGALPFLGLPASELLNLHISLEDIWGSEARRLYDHLMAAPTPAAKFRILEHALLARFVRAKPRDTAITYAVQAFCQASHIPSMLAFSESLGLSHKHFIHLFKRQVGLSPKVYVRLQRFQHALRSLTTHDVMSWSAIALEAGYFDQAHFIHDFRSFAGVTPMTYAEHRTAGRNHVKVPDG